MFIERSMFYYEFTTSEQAQLTRYLCMLKMDIRQFVSTQRYGSLAELQDASRRREIKIETQVREQCQDLDRSQPAAKPFKASDESLGSDGGRRRSRVCRRCGREGHFGRHCGRSARVCFHSDQEGHIRARCPFLVFGEVMDPIPLA